MFQQSSHSEIMTIIYLINHSTNKLFNEVCNQVITCLNNGTLRLPFPSPIRLGQHGRRVEFAAVVQRTDEKNKQGGEIGQHGQ